MSFSLKTKNDLARIKGEDRCCQIATLSGIVKVSGTLSFAGRQKINLSVSTENPAISRIVFILFKKAVGITCEVRVKKNNALKKQNTYITYVEDCAEMLDTLGILDNSGEYMRIEDGISKKIIAKECCRRAYIRGVFLGGGSLSDPEKGYHMEFVAHNETFASDLKDVINYYNLNAKMIERKNNYVVYIKEGDQIVDLLSVIGAHTTLLKFENVRILKQMRNNINRLVNCETANINKTADAAYNQLKDIELIKEKLGLESLSQGLRALAELRFENREATLKELGELIDPPIGKSGINHRFKKLGKIADEIREENGLPKIYS
jgi:DNA-binding protein WhiA